MRCSRPTGGNFTLTFGTEHGQTFASDAAPSAEPEEEELAQVRLGAQEDKFAANIVDLALIATRTGSTTSNGPCGTWSPATSRPRWR